MAPTHRLRNAVLSGSLILGAGLGAAGLAGAAGAAGTTSTTSTSPAVSSTTPCPHDAGQAPRAHETPLSGTDLAKATAAAEAAVPGASVVRAESDATGAYEVHLKKSDGTFVTVRLNSSFVETAIETGASGHHGAGTGPRGEGPMGPSGARGASWGHAPLDVSQH